MTRLITSAAPDWEARLSGILPLFGHRNWIVVADSAYPAQSRDGIETIASCADQLHVVKQVLDAIASSIHVRARIHVDKELAFVSEADSPGIDEYRLELAVLFRGAQVESLPHEQIIHKLDQAAQVFQIFIIKTEMTIPYTSVFFELDCGYWNSDAEQRLRQAIAASDSN